MYKKIIFTALMVSFLAACASVPMESEDASELARQFNPPPEGKAGLYIYRSSGIGTAIKRDIRVDGECIGRSAPRVFFYEELEAGREYQVSTQSEFSPNHLQLEVEAGEHYFIEQYMRMGVFVAGANVRQVEPEKGKAVVSGLSLAVKGECNK